MFNQNFLFMNVKNLNGMPDHQANLSRTGFDMSQEFAFTSSVGMILPVYQDFLNVGESVHFTGDLITRTQPLVTAAMCDIDVYLDWFFVPSSLIFTLWPSKRWLTNDVISSFYNADNIDDSLPLFDIESYLTNDGVWDYNASPAEWYSSIPQYAAGFECAGKSSFRLANHLGFNPYGIFKGNGSAKTAYSHADNPNVFPLFALAYQAIFNDYFRLPLDNFVKRQIQSFNVDQYWMRSAAVEDGDVSLFALHYRPRHMDYFTGFKVSPLSSIANLSSQEMVGDLLTKVDSFLDDRTVNLADNEDVDVSLSLATQTGLAGDNPVSTAKIRNLFAAEKLLRITGRAKKDYDSQVLAHFGFKVPHDVKHELTHICQQHCIIHVGEVISTSDTYDGENGSSLGAIGGKGYGVISGNAKNKPYKFTAPVDGVFMCCYSAAPRQRYFGTFDKQNNLVDRMSFYQPEFDKLGMQPLYWFEAFGFNDDAQTMSQRIGWQYRYEQWKRKYNRVSEAFAAPDIYDQKINNNVSWVNATKPFNTAFSEGQAGINPGIEGDGLFVQPTDINQIMVVPYLTAWDNSYNDAAFSMFYTDPFINAFRANVKKVSTMSSYGEPDLNGI